MTDRDVDYAVRQAMFAFLSESVMQYGDILPWSLLKNGIVVDGRHVPLIGQPGIITPKILNGVALTIRSTPRIEGKTQRYDDEIDADNNLLYSYLILDKANPERAKDHGHNVGLRKAMSSGVPLAYFYGVDEGRYIPEWPVFVVGDDPVNHRFVISISDRMRVTNDRAPYGDLVAEKKYSTVQVLQRDHQRAFSEKVFDAYRERCAICRIRHRELLDAAHILPDRDMRSEPRVSHGLSLCKIHHAAYDRQFLGIRADLKIELRRDLLDEPDGPMLEHGLKAFHDKAIEVPSSVALQPNRDHLAERYELFKRSA